MADWNDLLVNKISITISNKAYEDWDWVCTELKLKNGEERHEIFARLFKAEADKVENAKIQEWES